MTDSPSTDQPVPGSPGDGLIRLRLGISYDGGEYAGWARQPGQRTVQGEVERVLGHVLGTAVEVTCAGRTDAGVHARGQVAHVDVPAQAWPLTVWRVNRALPDDVRVTSIERAPHGFDARFSALWRRYAYRVCDDPAGPPPLERRQLLAWRRPLSIDLMNQAVSALLGEHDFAAFCRHRVGSTTVRELQTLAWHRRDDGIAVMTVQADAFCHSMVRSLVGAMIPVGEGKRPIDWPGQVLAAGLRDSAVKVMPAHGLVLEEVGYPAADQMLARQARTRSVRVLSREA